MILVILKIYMSYPENQIEEMKYNHCFEAMYRTLKASQICNALTFKNPADFCIFMK